MLTYQQILDEMRSLALPKMKIQSAKDKAFFTFDPLKYEATFTYSDGEELITKPCTGYAVVKACRSFGLSDGYARKIPYGRYDLLVNILNYHLEETRKNIYAFIGDKVEAFTSDAHTDHYPQEVVDIANNFLTESGLSVKGWALSECSIDGVIYTIILDISFEVNGDVWYPAIYVRDSLLGNLKLRFSPAFIRESDKAMIISVRSEAVSIRKDGTGYSIPCEECVRLALQTTHHELPYEQKKLIESVTSEATNHIGVFVRQVLKEMPVPRDTENAVLAEVDNAENMYQVITAFAKEATNQESAYKAERVSMLAGRVMVHRDICRHCHQEYVQQDD